MDKNMKSGLAIAVGVALIGGGYWLVRSQQAAAAYADAVGLCKIDAGAGSAKIKALDAIYGDSAQPRALRFDLSMCNLDSSVNDLNKLNAQIKALN
ncbi:hypothetical protein GCM10010873_26860 [Cypionkella aquatica]|uniref:Uncharacterized protein n=1 Tax=Cypionkella aquatica TaxID=1756042 RepID=A0AA37TUB8_9RHOB|nr:hypothetical protein [Cypionkella aquatica]GLS87712.1 hypothetical protein GCM10010873_26860 [Cypionkella aquatica]